MSWNGEIPHKDPNRVKGLCNKRKQKSIKALLAKQARQALKDATRPKSYGDNSYEG